MTSPHASGRAWVFGDRIDTDVLAPGHLMKLAPEDLARHCLEAVDPHFASSVRPGDFVVAGNGFGIGSSREQAAVSLKLLGVRAVLARSYGGIFRRNAINLGLPVLVLREAGGIRQGDMLTLNIAAARLRNVTTGCDVWIDALPEHLLNILGCGGLIPFLAERSEERKQVSVS